MGNCVGRKKSAMVWANEDDDDWEATESKKIPETEKQRLLGERSSPSSSSSSSAEPSGREVKIKITKKQLKELLGKVEAHSMPVDQVLSLMDSSNQFKVQHQRSWRPSLQSIPEVLDQ
ncbi:hypothetical protein Vadar_013853 [Vaccinium darrowii]|uniref:Uncharacterized protein n=1 Tax=Vaccinium darrowii TaxID=229202 RepID=A0ACB7XA53_9ERIC|nr:hypothetical protein Vadar_013853 [Vaccinium darrowii]